jgi:hypothetical protein
MFILVEGKGFEINGWSGPYLPPQMAVMQGNQTVVVIRADD